MKYEGLIKGSRTLDYGALLAVFGALQLALPEIQDALKGWYGVIFILMAALTGWLRYKTTTAVGEKEWKE